jgi:hypothetical protein
MDNSINDPRREAGPERRGPTERANTPEIVTERIELGDTREFPLIFTTHIANVGIAPGRAIKRLRELKIGGLVAVADGRWSPKRGSAPTPRQGHRRMDRIGGGA